MATFTRIPTPFPLTDGGPREPGLHWTDIVHAYAYENKIGYPPTDEITDEMRRTWELGYMWERTLGRGILKHPPTRPKPFKLDGIWMSPDGFDGTVYEFKFTSKSAERWAQILSINEDSKFWSWFAQGVGYCKAFDVTEIEYHPVFHVGSYGKGTPEDYLPWIVGPNMRAPMYLPLCVTVDPRERDRLYGELVGFAKEKGMLDAK